MNVTFCTFDEPNCVGGPNAWLRRLLPGLRAQGIESKVLALLLKPGEQPTMAALRDQGFECTAVLGHPYSEQRVRWHLEQVAQDPPDVFVPNLMVSAFYAGRWVREAGIPTVGVLHSDDAFHQGVQAEFVFGDTANRLSAIVCVSQYLENEVMAQSPVDTAVRRIPYGAPIPQQATAAPNPRMRLAYVGRLVEEQKRISEVTHALCRAAREVEDVEAVIYGEGDARPAVETILSTHGPSLPVTLAGRVDSERIQEQLLGCHTLVLLSDYEGLPIALMEAMACGVVPICLSARSGVTELVEDGVTGLLVRDRGDDFIAAVRRLHSEPGLWQRLSQAARARVMRDYSQESGAEKWAAMLWELKASSSARQPLRVPRRISLPPVHSGLIREDCRQPPAPRLLLEQSWEAARRVKRQLLGRGHHVSRDGSATSRG